MSGVAKVVVMTSPNRRDGDIAFFGTFNDQANARLPSAD
jgi:hypothetical protein